MPIGCEVVACGLDESGLLSVDAASDVSLDVTPQGDAGADVNYDVSLTCETGATLDTSCLGHTVPAGWVPVGYRENGGGCGSKSSEFDELPFVTDAQVPSGGCICGCSVSGSWSCVAELLTGDNLGGCGPPGAVTFVDASTCSGSEQQTLRRHGHAHGIACLRRRNPRRRLDPQHRRQRVRAEHVHRRLLWPPRPGIRGLHLESNRTRCGLSGRLHDTHPHRRYLGERPVQLPQLRARQCRRELQRWHGDG